MSTAPSAAMAARPALQPLGMGQIIRRTFGTMFRNLGHLVGMAVAVGVPPLAIFGLGHWLQSEVLQLLAFLVAYAAMLYYFAAVVLLVSDDIRGVRTSYLQIVRRMRGLLVLRFIGAALLQMTLAFLAALPGLLGIAYVSGSPNLEPAAAAMLVLLFLVAAAVPGAYVLVALLFAQPIVVVEQLGVRRALRRSWQLTSGQRWLAMRRIAGFLMVLWLLCLAVLAVLLAALPEMDPEAAGTLVAVVLEIIYMPPGLVFSVLLYYDLRTRKEHLNVEALFQDQ